MTTIQYILTSFGERIREGLPVAFGARVRMARVIRLLTQVQMGAFLGITQTEYSRIERGFNYPSPAMREQLAAALGVQVRWLEHGGALDRSALLPARRPGVFLVPDELAAFQASRSEKMNARAAENYAIQRAHKVKMAALRAQVTATAAAQFLIPS